MRIAFLNNKNKLNEFIATQPHSSFSQSWEWGEYQEICGNKIFRLGVEEEGDLMAAITFIKTNLPLGLGYFYAPRGPVVEVRSEKLEVKSIINELFKKVEKIGMEEKAIFFRFEPDLIVNPACAGMTIEKTIDVQPHRTSILDLSQTEEDILKKMHQKTRYNIRLAQKKGIEIIEAGGERFEDFWKLMEQTKDRDGFRLHGKEHYRKMISSVNSHRSTVNKEDLFIKLFLAKYQDQIIAGNIISFFGDTVTYMHGASADSFRNLMAPFLLHWHIIKSAKGLGYNFYDMFGIDEDKWPGVTRFKLGFSGEEKIYPGTFDLVFDKKRYNIYKLVRKIRRMA